MSVSLSGVVVQEVGNMGNSFGYHHLKHIVPFHPVMVEPSTVL